MLRTGELLTEDEFRKRLDVCEKQLARMISRGDVFTVEVDAVHYFPSLLAAPDIDLKRLYAVCRLLLPSPASCRLWYLSSRHVNLGGISPLEALRDEKQYRLLRRMAAAYAAEWSRTSVTIYLGCHQNEPSDTKPTLTAVDEVDPRVNIWKRTLDALQSGGYVHPCGPYPRASAATVFIAKHPAGQAPHIPEARIDVSVFDGIAHAQFFRRARPAYALGAIPVTDADSVVDIVIKFVRAARKSAMPT